MVFLISDFVDSGYEGALQRLARRHDVIAISLVDPHERRMPSAGLLSLHDAETGELVVVDSGSSKFRESFENAGTREANQRTRTFGSWALTR